MSALRGFYKRHKSAWPLVCLFAMFALIIALDKGVPPQPENPNLPQKRLYYRAFINQGIAAKQEGFYAEAIDALQFVVLTHTKGLPEWSTAASQLALTYELIGDQKHADQYYLLSAKYSPDAASMRKSAAYYRARRKAQERSNATSI